MEWNYYVLPFINLVALICNYYLRFHSQTTSLRPGNLNGHALISRDSFTRSRVILNYLPSTEYTGKRSSIGCLIHLHFFSLKAPQNIMLLHFIVVDSSTHYGPIFPIWSANSELLINNCLIQKSRNFKVEAEISEFFLTTQGNRILCETLRDSKPFPLNLRTFLFSSWRDAY